jgi:hypothetical protein
MYDLKSNGAGVVVGVVGVVGVVATGGFFPVAR